MSHYCPPRLKSSEIPNHSLGTSKVDALRKRGQSLEKEKDGVSEEE